MHTTDLEELGFSIQTFDELTAEQIQQQYGETIWVDEEKKQVDENEFAKAFRDIMGLQYHNGLFYTKNGKATEEVLSREIWEIIADAGINRNVEAAVKRLMGAVKLASTISGFTTSDTLIPFDNGDIRLDSMEFRENDYAPTAYRLRTGLSYNYGSMPHFSKWLSDLFCEEDIPTIQEYIGYCLVPSTKAQKSLFLVGEGGAGKSVLGVVLEAMLGEAMLSVSNTQEFLQGNFKLAELEHKLVLYDDDMDNAALTSTGLYKKLITNNIAITAERKYGQPFKFTPHVKLIACCNEMLTSAYDNTEGFYRRLLPVIIKPKAEDFKPDLNFYSKVRAEAPTIVQWALIGLLRLRQNEWVLSESQRSREYLANKRSIGNHFPDFMRSVFEFHPDYRCSSADIQAVYQVWCRQNACDPRKPKAVQTWMNDNAEKYKLVSSTNIPSGDKRVRGYIGLRIRDEWKISSSVISIK